jgi:hypothetical protein
MALPSFLETIACLDLIERRNYLSVGKLESVGKLGRTLFFKITRFQKALE